MDESKIQKILRRYKTKMRMLSQNDQEVDKNNVMALFFNRPNIVNLLEKRKKTIMHQVYQKTFYQEYCA